MSLSLLIPGDRLGKYEVIAHIATGGMGAVYKAKDRQLGRTVALKVLPTELAANTPILERFRREARHAARLSHPNIVTLFEYGHDVEANLHFLAMEFIDGINLQAYIERRGKLVPEEVRRILVKITKALDHAFTHGIVHRDIKPSNILLAKGDKKSSVKLTDLGLAVGVNDNEYKVTRDGSTVGTIDYMSPEQARDSHAADIRSDIYSLGCTAYHMLAGRAPFAAGGLGERLYKHLNVPPTDVRELSATVSSGFWAILLKMLAKLPEDRYATPAELLIDLKKTPAEGSEDDELSTVIEDIGQHKTEFVPPPRVEPTPEARPRRRKRKSRKQPAVEPMAPAIPVEQARTASAYHERAVEVMAEGGGSDYALQLLANCLKLDPFNTAYRQTLRELNVKAAPSTLGRWFGSLNVLAIKSKMRLARSNSDWRTVLDHGEEVLARQPADVETHIEMAEAAEQLQVPHLAHWLLEQACEQIPDNGDLLRALARFHEKRRDWKPAVAYWQKVRELDPNDYEAGRKINDLSAQDLLANGHYRH
jgi:serine/threonine protein kinase